MDEWNGIKRGDKVRILHVFGATAIRTVAKCYRSRGGNAMIQLVTGERMHVSWAEKA